MKLKRIVLTDFRCFYDEQVIDFSFDRDKNVTLIHAENGVGKTTLLNALIWCFYGDTTARFEMKEDIVNHQARKEGRHVATIEVEFEHEGQDYTANRAFDARNPHSDSQLKVSELTFGDAIPKTIDAPSLFINSVLPKDMAGNVASADDKEPEEEELLLPKNDDEADGDDAEKQDAKQTLVNIIKDKLQKRLK